MWSPSLTQLSLNLQFLCYWLIVWWRLIDCRRRRIAVSRATRIKIFLWRSRKRTEPCLWPLHLPWLHLDRVWWPWRDCTHSCNCFFVFYYFYFPALCPFPTETLITTGPSLPFTHIWAVSHTLQLQLGKTLPLPLLRESFQFCNEPPGPSDTAQWLHTLPY